MKARLKVPAPAADHSAVRLNRGSMAFSLADERGIVASFMLRLVLVLALIGIVFVEGGAIVFSKLQAQDIAESAAVAGAGSLSHTRSANTARAEAIQWMNDKSERAQMTAFTASPDGSVTVTVRLRANTLLLQHIGFLAPYAVSKATATADPPDPGL